MDNQEKRKFNEKLLAFYDCYDINAPQVILRKVNKVDGDILDDDLYCVTFTSDMNFNNVPDEFSWAKRDLLRFKTAYIHMLNEPTERVHLETISRTGCRIFIEDRCSKHGGNGKDKDAGYAGMSTYVYYRPAVFLVHDLFNNTTLLHEAIHNSDFKLKEMHFSSLTLHQAAMMMIDAQRIERHDGKEYKTAQQCRVIDRYYQSGSKYDEGLAWITQIPLTELSKEKNHVGKNLKILHSIYTEAVLRRQLAIVDCFKTWLPSEHIYNLLTRYNANGQMPGEDRIKIQKQELTFWQELVKFRKGINKLKNMGLEYEQLDISDIGIYRQIGGSCVSSCGRKYLASRIPLYLAKGKAKAAFEADTSLGERVKHLQKLFKEIAAKDLHNDTVFADKAMVCWFYIQRLEECEAMPKEYTEIHKKIEAVCKAASLIEKRKQMYDILKNSIEQWGRSAHCKMLCPANLCFLKPMKDKILL